MGQRAHWPLLVLLLGMAFPGPRAGAQALTWWVEPATRKVMQDRAPQAVRAVQIEAARNEYEPFQVVLRADGGALDNVSARISDLIGPDGAVIPAENVTFYRAYYVTVTLPSGTGQGDGLPGGPRQTGEYVDPLIPFYDPYNPTHYAVGTPFSITQNRLQPIFGDVYVPADAPAGIYEGTVEVTVDFTVAARVPVSLRVWDFALPRVRRIATAYGMSFGAILHYHGGPDAERIIHNYEETLHDFRLDITDPVQGPPGLPSPFFTFDAGDKLIPPDYSAYDAYIEPRLDGSYWKDGSNAVMYNSELFHPGTGHRASAFANDDEYVQAAADFARHLKEKGWWDRIYVYVHDEPYLYPGALDAIAFDVVLMDMGDPDWKTRMMATNHWVRELDYVIGIWCPLTTNYDQWFSTLPEYTREDYQGLIRRGDKLWFYVCNGTKPPYAGYDIDTVLGQEPRILHWGAWYEGATGMLFWSTTYWDDADPWGTLLNLDAFPTMARNGDGFLIYPGDHNGTLGAGVGSPSWISLDGPVITHRLMMIREGMEDMEYFQLAADMGGKEAARRIISEVYTQFGMNPDYYDPENPPWSQDENALYAARHELAAWIEQGPREKIWDNGGGNGGCALGQAPVPQNRWSFALAVMFVAMVWLAGRAGKTGAPRPASRPPNAGGRSGSGGGGQEEVSK